MTLTTADEKKINAFETKCYRRILRIPWIAKRKNTEILNELKVGQDWLLNNIKARKLSYLGHLKRHDSLEKHILEARREGKRRKGRPTRRWTEDIKKWLQMSPTEAGREAQKREAFRRMIREAASTQTCQDETIIKKNSLCLLFSYFDKSKVSIVTLKSDDPFVYDVQCCCIIIVCVMKCSLFR